MKNLYVAPVTSIGNLYLGAIPVETGAAAVEVKQPRHLMLVVDKSGSMYSTLPRLIEDVKRLVRGLDKGDALTFAWFSSKGECGFPIKAFRIVDENSFLELDRLFDSHKSALNLTCFSDVLGQIETVLKETEFMNTRNFLTFFSDGWANSPSVVSEHEKCRAIMKNLSGKFDLVLTVAYSDYADRDFLTELATLAGGEGVSAADLRQFTDSFERFLKRSERSVPRIPVNLGDLLPMYVFSVDRNPETGGINLYEPDENNIVHLAPAPDKSEQNIYFISRDNPELNKAIIFSGEQFDLQDDILQLGEWTDGARHGLLTAAFASSVVLSQNGRQDDAIDVLGYLGDERLVKLLGNAYTPTEKANVEDEIRHAIFNDAARWAEGVNMNCVPDADAFCLLDLLNVLQTDVQARFHPRHPAFRYKKIGRKAIQRPGYPDFLPDAGASSPISDLVWNSELLNLSIRAKIRGTVILPSSITVDADGKLSENGATTITRPATLDEDFQTFVWRNYALVKDGFLNVSKFPAEVSDATAYLLKEKGVFAVEQESMTTQLGVIHLDGIPVINRRIAEKTPTAKSLAENVYADEVFGAQIKVLKALRPELDPKNEIVSRSEWKPEEQRFLFALGFSADGSFSPPTDTAEATDAYDAVAFKIAVKGFSSLPKLSEVRDKLKSGKPLNAPGRAMGMTLEVFNNDTELFSPAEKLNWIDKNLNEMKRNQIIIRTEVQKPKFAMVLAHKSFSDIILSDTPTEVVFEGLDGDLTAKISITKKQIKI